MGLFGNKHEVVHSVRLVRDKAGAPAVDLEKVAATRAGVLK